MTADHCKINILMQQPHDVHSFYMWRQKTITPRPIAHNETKRAAVLKRKQHRDVPKYRSCSSPWACWKHAYHSQTVC